ncbi:hypothetical protein [Hyalangium versicolor]|uniref:hypothetical protein n=1 Tax=Hyalangium versicolor TaxID=2861190 RepID=UPI001CCDEC34|nr:hypothetical protein [Hyalangium versicolor]
MRLRALSPILLCASAMWPLCALACFNSMDKSLFVFTRTLWLDLVVWTLGALFLNRVVLVNVRGSTVEGQPQPSWFRRAFFLLVGAALVLLLAALSAGGPLFSLASYEMARCSLDRSMLLVLLILPAALFTLQAVLFQKLGTRLFGGQRSVAIASLVFTSVLLVLVVGMSRDAMVLPYLCKFTEGAYTDESGQY